ncbi:MAG TPA: hypothetical protein VMA77_18855, partial [Solirubrobacteraceae bacterium]|nr:hypothetical protein [Solirubrobacteraceae bacterium]
ASEQQLDDKIGDAAAERSQPFSPPSPILATPPGAILVLVPSPHMTSPAVHSRIVLPHPGPAAVQLTALLPRRGDGSEGRAAA